jgi:hypothetical protein
MSHPALLVDGLDNRRRLAIGLLAQLRERVLDVVDLLARFLGVVAELLPELLALRLLLEDLATRRERAAGRLTPRGLALPPLHKGASMTGEAKTTTDPETIRAWVEAHGGRPARVRGTGDGDDPGILRIDFPGGAGEDSLEPIAWEEWFQKFNENNLAFLYQDEKASGEDSTFFKLVEREGD